MLESKSVDAFYFRGAWGSSFRCLALPTLQAKLLLSFEGMGEAEALVAYEATREAAAKIIQDMGYTCYSIGVIVKEVMQAIVQHSKQVCHFPRFCRVNMASTMWPLSVPCIVDSSGISGILECHSMKRAKQLQTLQLF